MKSLTTTRQPTTSAVPCTGIGASVGHARRYRIRQWVRRADGFGRGDVVPMGILLKEGET